MSENDFWKLSAVEAVQLLKKGELKPTDLILSAIKRIEAVDGKINALPIRCFDRALKQADRIEKNKKNALATVLSGLPIAVKDYNDVGGVPTTYGSPIFAQHIPKSSDVTINKLEERGAIPLAKSNVPEWAGGHTFNPVFGITRNPWDTDLSAGGSSGGSAAALASGQVWLATGNDLGGSLRTPAGFNGIVGLRPSPGVIPRGRRLQSFDTLWVEGPMARSVEDVALMLDAGKGQSLSDPISFINSIDSYLGKLRNKSLPKRIAYSNNLNIVPVSNEISEITKNAVRKINEAGVDVSEEIPDFSGTIEAFHTLRSLLLGTMMGDLLQDHRENISNDIVKNIEAANSVTPKSYMHAERVRWTLSHHMANFFKDHDFLLCPSSSIPPFPVEKNFVSHIGDEICESYIDWFSITFALTLTSCPVISIPCGFTHTNLPVGLQIVGKPRGELQLLQAAAQFEKIFDVSKLLPIDPNA